MEVADTLDFELVQNKNRVFNLGATNDFLGMFHDVSRFETVPLVINRGVPAPGPDDPAKSPYTTVSDNCSFCNLGRKPGGY
jgi:hypothetical protein